MTDELFKKTAYAQTIENSLKENGGLLGIAEDVYLRILRTSMPQFREDLATIDAALKEGSCANIQPAAHRLKGAFGNLRLEELRLAAETIDLLAREQDSPENIRPYFEKLLEMFKILGSVIGDAK